MRLVKRWRSAVLGAVLAAAAVVAIAPPASAEATICPVWSSQQDVADTASASCRSTWLVEPGIGNFNTRSNLLRNKGLYEDNGFTQQFLWYARPGTLHVPLGSTQEWTSCPPGEPYGVDCPRGTTLLHHKIRGNFTNVPFDLSVFEYDGRWIARVCGNYGYPLPASRDPVPTIAGLKFDDRNRNGRQDPDEPGLGGFTFQLIRESSLFSDQAPGFVTSTVSRSDGSFTFPLQDIGPGNYVVQEVAQDDWTPTTNARQSVTVGDGIGDDTLYMSFGNAFDAISAVGTTVTATEGLPYSGTVATFTDPDKTASASEYAASIDWGDGTTPSGGMITRTGEGTFAVTGTHTYVEESHRTLTVTIGDVDNASNHATATSQAHVADAELTPGTPMTVAPIEGASFTGAVGTFTDGNPDGTTSDFSATIDWGDHTTSAGSVTGPAGGPFSVSGSHTYIEEGSYPVTITVADEGGSTTTVAGTATVGDAALKAAGCQDLLSTNPVGDLPVATFTDANPYGSVADFTAAIDWGDNTISMGTVTGPVGGPFTVTGSHNYSRLGPETITVYIVDDGGSTAVACSHLIVFAYSDFVVGDGNAAVGDQVTFWGSQWSKENALSGGSAPDAFKGFTNSGLKPTCGGSWTTRPGDSSNPPDTVPSYIAVAVSSRIVQNGSTISGDVQHVVIVRTGPGYADNPGHPGTGDIVAVLC